MDQNQILTDAYPPREIAHRVEELGVNKAKLSALSVLVLAILAGAFISMGAAFYMLVSTGSTAGFGLTRLAGGVSFSLGLILVVVAGAELFTGNNLIAMAWASGRIGIRDVLRNWILSYSGNVIGCLISALLVYWAELGSLSQGGFAETALKLAESKATLSPLAAFCRGILCNALVCLAVWLTQGGRSVTDKILSILFPVSAFVALGLEHSIANWFFFPYALLLDSGNTLNAPGMVNNLFFVTLGNIIGGTLLVSAVYWLAYLRAERS